MLTRWPLMVFLLLLSLILSGAIALGCGGQTTTGTATPSVTEATAAPAGGGQTAGTQPGAQEPAEDALPALIEALESGDIELVDALPTLIEALESEEFDLEDALTTLVEALEDLDPELLDLESLGLDLELFDLSSLVDGEAAGDFNVGQFDLGDPSGAGGGGRRR